MIFRRWVTGTPPVTHTYIQAIKLPTLGYLTRSVRRRAATSKRDYRHSAIRTPLVQFADLNRDKTKLIGKNSCGASNL